jgi:uncharacterized membrane protein YphA (DoxX/SURF4 family)
MSRSAYHLATSSHFLLIFSLMSSYLSGSGGSNSISKSHNDWATEFRTVAVLRIGAALLVFLEYGLEGSIRAWSFIWRHTEWPVVDAIAAAGWPYPSALGPAAAFIALGVSIAWFFGFLTRVFSIAFLPVLFATLLIVERANAGGHQAACWLLIFTSITLILYGSGKISLDWLFSLRSGKRSKR